MDALATVKPSQKPARQAIRDVLPQLNDDPDLGSARQAVRDVLRGKITRSTALTELDLPTFERLQCLRAQGQSKWCVLFSKESKEHRTPWFYSMDRCMQALEILKAKHGGAPYSAFLLYMD